MSVLNESVIERECEWGGAGESFLSSDSVHSPKVNLAVTSVRTVRAANIVVFTHRFFFSLVYSPSPCA